MVVFAHPETWRRVGADDGAVDEGPEGARGGREAGGAAGGRRRRGRKRMERLGGLSVDVVVVR